MVGRKRARSSSRRRERFTVGSGGGGRRASLGGSVMSVGYPCCLRAVAVGVRRGAVGLRAPREAELPEPATERALGHLELGDHRVEIAAARVKTLGDLVGAD